MDVLTVSATRLSRRDEDDEPLREALLAAGISSATVRWDDPAVDWGGARMAILRSTWNYVQNFAAFMPWAERCASLTELWNPLPIIRWNGHKAYLVELAARGVPVVPTRLVRRGETASLRHLAGDWPDVVIKPEVSSASYRTLRAPSADPRAQVHLAALLETGDALVQPYLPSVESYGERACVWIDGEFTHSVRKTPRFTGDPHHVSDALPIAADEFAVAEAAIALAPRPLMYGRVDLMRDASGAPAVSELELIEPSLYLVRHLPAMARMVAAIAARL